jgi:hypothetical protein
MTTENSTAGKDEDKILYLADTFRIADDPLKTVLIKSGRLKGQRL